MDILVRLKDYFSAETRAYSDASWDEMAAHVSGGASASGKTINSDNALTSSAVYACVRVLAETIAALPLMVYKRTNDGKGKEPAISHSLYPLLHDSPNTFQTSYEFREMSMGHLSLRGNSFALKEMNGAGRITGLFPLNPANMKVTVDKDSEIVYEYTWPDGPSEFYTQEEIWHIKGLSSDGIVGLSPVTLAREAIGLALATEEHGARLFSNNAQPGGTLEIPGKLSEEAAGRLKKSWGAAHAGGQNAHKVAVLEGGLTWKAVSMSNEDSQFLETRNFQVEDIARIFRVPSVLIGHSDKASTFASAEQFFLSFVVHTVTPWAKRIEQSANMHLLSGRDRRKYFVEFNIDGLLRGDIKSRTQAYAIAIQNEWMSANEVRAKENMNPREGGDEFKNPNINVKEGDNFEEKE